MWMGANGYPEANQYLLPGITAGNLEGEANAMQEPKRRSMRQVMLFSSLHKYGGYDHISSSTLGGSIGGIGDG